MMMWLRVVGNISWSSRISAFDPLSFLYKYTNFLGVPKSEGLFPLQNLWWKLYPPLDLMTKVHLCLTNNLNLTWGGPTLNSRPNPRHHMELPRHTTSSWCTCPIQLMLDTTHRDFDTSTLNTPLYILESSRVPEFQSFKFPKF
jgi:hypothetical protein